MKDRMEQLVDRWKIAEAFYAYAFHFDRNEPTLVGELFTSDATIDYGPEMGPIHGSKALIDRISIGLEEVFAATSHHISNISVGFEDDMTAHAVAYVYAWHRYRDGSPDGYLYGQYHTRLVRTGDEWKFTQLTLNRAGSVEFHRTDMYSIGRESRPST